MPDGLNWILFVLFFPAIVRYECDMRCITAVTGRNYGIATFQNFLDAFHKHFNGSIEWKIPILGDLKIRALGRDCILHCTID